MRRATTLKKLGLQELLNEYAMLHHLIGRNEWAKALANPSMAKHAALTAELKKLVPYAKLVRETILEKFNP